MPRPGRFSSGERGIYCCWSSVLLFAGIALSYLIVYFLPRPTFGLDQRTNIETPMNRNSIENSFQDGAVGARKCRSEGKREDRLRADGDEGEHAEDGRGDEDAFLLEEFDKSAALTRCAEIKNNTPSSRSGASRSQWPCPRHSPDGGRSSGTARELWCCRLPWSTGGYG
ncbi:unnamed protein product [Ectocarpus sp. 12 AP-2014]